MQMTSKYQKPAFLNIFLGGVGTEAARVLRELYEADGKPFPARLVQIDTDPIPSPHVDQSILLPLDGLKVDAITSDPERFGPIAVTIVQHYSKLLNPEDVHNGARTIRLLTQLAFLFFRDKVIQQLRNCLIGLATEGGFDAVIPVFISSSGGGTGSALQILLAQAFLARDFRSYLTEGFKLGFLETPIAFAVEPFALAMRHKRMHADKVLGNSYAFRYESSLLEEPRGFKYLFHVGFASDQGTVLDTPDEIAMVLGTSIYQLERNWLAIKSKFVDVFDVHILQSRYGGTDIPEKRLRSPTAIPVPQRPLSAPKNGQPKDDDPIFADTHIESHRKGE